MPYAVSPVNGTIIRYDYAPGAERERASATNVPVPPNMDPPWTRYPERMELVCKPSASFLVLDGRVHEDDPRKATPADWTRIL